MKYVMGFVMCFLGVALLLFSVISGIQHEYARACYEMLLSWQSYFLGMLMLEELPWQNKR